MSIALRITFMLTMTIALSFGFMHHFIADYNFERLHIFLFNLCTGGTIILYFTMDKGKMTKRLYAFFLLSFVYAFLAFFEYYALAIAISLILFGIVESVRNIKFSFFPWDFFTRKVPTAQKFHHASLLCLSIGLLISISAIVNQEYYTFIHSEKLTLNTFFLGFSFPVSLISLSVMFTTMHKAPNTVYRDMKVISFWTITMGVIVFFVFILFEAIYLELAISVMLFISVSCVLYLYIRLGIKEQQKAYLTSGIVFLLMTSVTGVLYILIYAYGYTDPFYRDLTITYHRTLALYGWNISGLAVICRFKDFPIMLHSGPAIALHWLIVALLAPMAFFNVSFVIPTLIAYLIFLFAVFFSKGNYRIKNF
ncbi:conserved hypothetical protein [Denitrovibrio acetiphilus DSM 12809]|uniref:Uncharacterized protein n=1 Tax=Denitrovibrio acetiphilus (strain DSM 12809 / NBRC 114555 / N2460) TaxID=522772 RepID=D4H6H4_DENA2|nr:hypothetical protein [Denitrovibrio acetiphilus]ADD69648.1 conserved hypothetical protein [Denitrovibrio acetiphilus DSM 12809]